MRPSRKALAAQVADQSARIEQLVRERDQHKGQALANITALRLISRELSDLKDELALHIVAAEHSSSALSDAASLREACEARGINLQVELARLEGGQL
ncbi:MAG: hypothetical protein HOY75_13470 [Streptomyces sp.]|nr:hypothetical protein [Streptomyces sp.]